MDQLTKGGSHVSRAINKPFVFSPSLFLASFGGKFHGDKYVFVWEREWDETQIIGCLQSYCNEYCFLVVFFVSVVSKALAVNKMQII